MGWLTSTICFLVSCLAFANIKWNPCNCSKKPPHIVVIIGDDMGWNDVGYHGSNQIPTPNIDALGYNGVILDKFYTQQTCTPSRAAFLTGNYPIRTGLQGVPISAGENRALPLTMPTMPQHLKGLGYETHLVGKWHLGAAMRDHLPTRKGFDTHFGYWNGFVGYFNYYAYQDVPVNQTFKGLDVHEKFEPVWSSQGRYATELFTEKSLEIIENHQGDAPLFLVLAHLAAHTGANGDELGVPDVNVTDAKYHYIQNPRRRLYADIVNILDDSVGRVVEKLSSKNMLENSIVLFMSDNGAQTVGLYENHGSNWPMRGLKFTLHEGGVRGTATIYSPLFQKKNYVNRELLHISDWLPTFYAAAGGDLSKLGQIDGVNQWETLSKNSPTKRQEILVNIDANVGQSGIISNQGRYKLLNGTFNNGIYDQYYGEDGRGVEVPLYDPSKVLGSRVNVAVTKLRDSFKLTAAKIEELRSQVDLTWCRAKDETPNFVCSELCLFDLLRDPCETTNIVGERPDIVARLKKRLDVFVGEMVRQTNTAVDLNSNPARYNNTWCTWLDDELCFKTS